MTTVFASLVRPPVIRAPSTDKHGVLGTASSVPKAASEDIELRSLNASLQSLTNLFPNIQPEVFREMLSSVSEESRLQVITEMLLKDEDKHVQGRHRMPSEREEHRDTARKFRYRKAETPTDTRGRPLALEDTFRTTQYKTVSKEALYREFKGLSHSTIKAVLAEYNWSYSRSRPTLLALSSKSWRSSITNFIMRRKAPNAKDHPLVLWTTADAKIHRPRMPMLVKTGSDELNMELFEALILPELERQRCRQMREDLELALKYSEEEATDACELYDCECCFIPTIPQQLSSCDVSGHYLCFQCIRHAIKAALYDQGWAKNIKSELCTLRCIAPSAGSADECQGCVPFSFVKRALRQEEDGQKSLDKLNERFVAEALVKSRVRLVQCPFCPYAEFDESSLGESDLLSALTIRPRPLISSSCSKVTLVDLLFYRTTQAMMVFLVLLYSTITACVTLPTFPSFRTALQQIHRKRRGLRFQCLNPKCLRSSCLTCSAPWYDPHACFSSQRTSLRLALERATTDAIKRTCPKCNLAFVKSSGCNKLVCLCGYAMCYICREGLKDEGYQHFCGHFRARPGEACSECTKCDLYRVEDEAAAIKRAIEKAEKDWWNQQGFNEGHNHERIRKDIIRGTSKRNDWGWDWNGWIERALDSILV